MNIPKPAIWAGLVALIGAYAVTQATDSPGNKPAASASSHTHADGTVHEGDHAEDEGKAAASPAAPLSDPSGGQLRIVDVTKGSGTTATDGKTLSMHYRGTLSNGKQFDSSYDKGTPFSFTLGAGEVIKGWDQGIKGMKVGGKRKLVIPASLGYGDRGAGQDIPPGATLLFDVELLDVK